MPKQINIALFGGAFDPPHVGHTMTALWALTTGFIDRVWVLPSYVHPWNKDMGDFEHRMEMCRQAFEIFEGVSVKDDERNVGGEGYTIELVKHLKEVYPEEYNFALLVGSDNWAHKDKWNSWDELQSLVGLMVLGREGFDLKGTVKVCNVSSTDIRKALKEGEECFGENEIPLAYGLPRSVFQYIHDNGLYE